MIDDLIDVWEMAEASAHDVGSEAAGLALAARTVDLPFVLGDAHRLRAEVRAALRWLIADSGTGTKTVSFTGGIEPARPAWLRVELSHGSRSHRLMLPLAGAVPLGLG